MVFKEQTFLRREISNIWPGFNEAGRGAMWQKEMVNEIVLFRNNTGHLFCFALPFKLPVFILSTVNYLLALYI